jgi:hypothetical protein
MADGPKSVVALARFAMLATVFVVLVWYVVFVVVQPELNPLYRYTSEYTLGRMGWLMKLAFFVWSAGMLALALAFANGLDAAARSRTAIILFTVAGAAVPLPGVFDADLQVINPDPPPLWIVPDPPSTEQGIHAMAGLVGLLCLLAGAGFAARRLRLAGRLRSKYYILRPLSWLSLVAFFPFMFFLASQGLAGLGQRIVYAFVFAWLIIAARGLATGAFSQTS